MDLGPIGMFNKSMNFIRRLNRKKNYFKQEFSNIAAN